MKIIVNSEKYGSFEVFYDEGDHDLLSKFKWHIIKGRNTFYCIANTRKENGKTTTVKMHKLLTGWSMTDHSDRNGLNNQRYNLREASCQENNRNATRQKNNTTGYRGVDYNKDHKAFRARVNVNRKSVYCRYFKTATEAALAYNEAAKIHFGEFANLNVIL